MIRIAFPGYGEEPAETLYFEAVAVVVDAKMQLSLIDGEGGRRVIAVRDKRLGGYWAVDPGVLRASPLLHGDGGERLAIHHGTQVLGALGRGPWTFYGIDDEPTLFVHPFDSDLVDYVACLDRSGLWVERASSEALPEIFIAHPEFLLADLYLRSRAPRARPSSLSS